MLAYIRGSWCVVGLAGCVAFAAWLAGAVALCLWSCVVGAVVSAALVVVCWAWLRGWL